MKIRNILLAVLAFVGAYVLLSIPLGMISTRSENTCTIFWSKEYPSPNGTYKLIDNLANCGNHTYKREIELHGGNDREGIPIIYLSNTGVVQKNGLTYSPPPVGIAWDGDFKIILSIVEERPKRAEKYGEISVEFKNIF